MSAATKKQRPRKVLLTPQPRMPYSKTYDVDIDIGCLSVEPLDILCLALRRPGRKASSYARLGCLRT